MLVAANDTFYQGAGFEKEKVGVLSPLVSAKNPCLLAVEFIQ